MLKSKSAGLLALLSMLLMSIGLVVNAQDEKSFVIGVSNSFVSSEWRTQMLQNIQDAVDELAGAGITIELVVESADTDAQGQIQQIQNLVNRGVDAIIINPGDQSALNLALEDAVAQGIVVIAVDQEIAAQGVYNIAIDQNEWAKLSISWLAEALGGAGDIVLIEGFVGHPANEARMAGVAEILANYPDINVVGRETGSWDEATAQGVMSDFLASIPNIDGVWTQDSMATGVLTAINTANPENRPLNVGEARASYVQAWQAQLEADPEFTSFAVVNPPGVGADGLRIAVELLLGGEVDASKLAGPFGNTLYMPIPYTITDETVLDYYEDVKDLPESYTLDGLISQSDAYSYFVQ